MAADSALGGVLEKNGDHLPSKTQEILKKVQVKFQSKPGADHAGEGGNGSNGVGNGGAGHDTLTGGHDTMVGGHDAGAGVTKLGAMKLPDLSGIKAGPLGIVLHAARAGAAGRRSRATCNRKPATPKKRAARRPHPRSKPLRLEITSASPPCR
jgi:hypothetical protein